MLELSPSDTANLDPDLILGFVTTKGGPTSHIAIIARAMGVRSSFAHSISVAQSALNCRTAAEVRAL